jgi:hypothetical protein
VQISKDGGGQPRWRPGDGKELYYRELSNGAIMAVSITVDAGGNMVWGSPEARYALTRVVNGVTLNPARHQLAVHPDGKQFLLRVGTGAVANTGTGTSTVPLVNPQTRDSTVGQRRGRGGRGGLDSGLTIVQRWTSGLGKGAK